IELSATVVRYHDSVRPEAYRIARILWIKNSLDDHRTFPEFPNPFHILPGNRRIEILAQPANVILQAGLLAQIPGHVAQVMRSSPQTDIPGPARVKYCLQVATDGGVWPAHARMRIPVTRARHRQIHREHESADPGCLGALQNILHETAIPQHIKLKPHGPLDFGNDFLN